MTVSSFGISGFASRAVTNMLKDSGRLAKMCTTLSSSSREQPVHSPTIKLNNWSVVQLMMKMYKMVKRDSYMFDLSKWLTFYTLVCIVIMFFVFT